MAHPNTVLLLSIYDLGRRPMALALAAGWFQQARLRVHCLDLSIQNLNETLVRQADCIALHVPMHTATRLAAGVLPRLKALNPKALLVCWGLYGPPNQAWLQSLGAAHVLGAECEPDLVALVEGTQKTPPGAPKNRAKVLAQNLAKNSAKSVPLPKLKHPLSVAAGLPSPEHYAVLKMGKIQRKTAAVEATRGCKHTCTHCPITPMYQGQLRVVAAAVVLDAIDTQVELGAEHVSFADADFLNAPRHSLNIVRAMQKRHPKLSYDVTIKVEHLLKHAKMLPILRDTGCVLVTTAVETFEPLVLNKLQKNHSAKHAVDAILLLRNTGLGCNPTFVPFTPWSTPKGIHQLLQWVQRLGLVPLVAPVQYGIRLLLPQGSPIVQDANLKPWLLPFDAAKLHTPWRAPDARLDALQQEFADLAQSAQSQKMAREEVFAHLQQRVNAWVTPAELGRDAPTHDSKQRPPLGMGHWSQPAPWVLTPQLSEPWFC